MLEECTFHHYQNTMTWKSKKRKTRHMYCKHRRRLDPGFERPKKFRAKFPNYLLLKGEWHICVVSTCGTPTPAAVFLSVEKRLTLCTTGVMQKKLMEL